MGGQYAHGNLTAYNSLGGQATAESVERRLSAAIPVPSNTFTVPFNSTVVNTDAFSTPGPAVAVTQHAGVHQIAGSLSVFHANAGLIEGVIRVNGQTLERFAQSGPAELDARHQLFVARHAQSRQPG